MKKQEPGEHDLLRLLASMTPTLAEEEFVFITVDQNDRPTLQSVPICEFHETEGVTLIIPKLEAERSELEYAFPCRLITLNVHSSLSAVGVLAAITPYLAKAKISVNAVSAFYHDHFFVPSERAEEAMNILKDLTENAVRKITLSSK